LNVDPEEKNYNNSVEGSSIYPSIKMIDFSRKSSKDENGPKCKSKTSKDEVNWS